MKNLLCVTVFLSLFLFQGCLATLGTVLPFLAKAPKPKIELKKSKTQLTTYYDVDFTRDGQVDEYTVIWILSLDESINDPETVLQSFEASMKVMEKLFTEGKLPE